MERTFAVSNAYYFLDDEIIEIAGVPEYGSSYFGEYISKWPYQAASKALTGLHKHMKKFNKSGKNWFPGYNPDSPPDVFFKLVDLGTSEEIFYHGKRVPAHQGQRIIQNNNDDRVRHYKWDNKLEKLNS